MLKLITAGGLIASLGTAYMTNMKGAVQEALNQGKKAFGGHANKIDSLSREGENSYVFDQNGNSRVRSAFGGAQPGSPYGTNTTAYPTHNYQYTNYNYQYAPVSNGSVPYGSQHGAIQNTNTSANYGEVGNVSPLQ